VNKESDIDIKFEKISRIDIEPLEVYFCHIVGTEVWFIEPYSEEWYITINHVDQLPIPVEKGLFTLEMYKSYSKMLLSTEQSQEINS
jgi:hypothetical protein